MLFLHSVLRYVQRLYSISTSYFYPYSYDLSVSLSLKPQPHTLELLSHRIRKLQVLGAYTIE